MSERCELHNEHVGSHFENFLYNKSTKQNLQRILSYILLTLKLLCMFFQRGGISGFIPFVITQLLKTAEILRKNSINQTTGSQILSFKP